MEDLKFISVVLAVVSILVGLIAMVIRYEIRFNKLSIKITALEQRIEPFWEIIKNNVTKLFTENPSEELLAKMRRIDSLTREEIIKAKEEFEEEIIYLPFVC